MSEGFPSLQPTEADIEKLIMAQTHIGSKNCAKQMTKYVFKRRADGVNIIDVHKTWEKIVLAARIIAAIEHPSDICAVSGVEQGQRAILKFCSHIGGAFPIAGRFTPGAFTNQIQKAFQEPRLLVLTDPRVDHQAVREASYVNIPIIALCDVDAPLRFVDVVIPCNNKSPHAIGIVWWMLAREVLRLRGTLSRESEWDIMPDLYFWRDPAEIAQEELEAAQAAEEAQQQQFQQWDGAEATDAPTDPAALAAAATAAAAGIQPIGGAPANADWTAAAPANTGFDAPTGGDWGASTGGDWAATGGDDWAATQ
eukprot:TRINITY_DN9545_c1_g1_i2.p2 TRINITY_DN9545_c1_g1~~TRINITY_DN9545_c1_g1_i2.p2  ORF type:complete len:310 (+),score=90.46 TRINITY_DN9545_c1_g1_i2:44-973(+)